MARKKTHLRANLKNHQGKRNINDKQPLSKEKLDDGILVGSLGKTVKFVILFLLVYLMTFDRDGLFDLITLFASIITIVDYYAK